MAQPFGAQLRWQRFEPGYGVLQPLALDRFTFAKRQKSEALDGVQKNGRHLLMMAHISRGFFLEPV
jgi:hypothetical protein